MLEMSQDGQFLNGEYILRHSQRCAWSPFPRARSCRTTEMHAQLACARAGGGGSFANEGLREVSGGSGRFFPIGVFVHLNNRSRWPLDLDSIRLPYTATDDRQRIHNKKGAGTPDSRHGIGSRLSDGWSRASTTAAWDRRTPTRWIFFLEFIRTNPR